MEPAPLSRSTSRDPSVEPPDCAPAVWFPVGLFVVLNHAAPLPEPCDEPVWEVRVRGGDLGSVVHPLVYNLRRFRCPRPLRLTVDISRYSSARCTCRRPMLETSSWSLSTSPRLASDLHAVPPCLGEDLPVLPVPLIAWRVLCRSCGSPVPSTTLDTDPTKIETFCRKLRAVVEV